MGGTTTPSENVTRCTTPKSPATIVFDGCFESAISTLHCTARIHRAPFHFNDTVCLAFDVLGEAALDPSEFWKASSLVGFVYFKRCWVALGETDFSLRRRCELWWVNLLTLKEALVRVVQFPQDALQSMYGGIL